MKKNLVIILSSVLILSFIVGCSPSTPTYEGQQEKTNTETTNETQEENLPEEDEIVELDVWHIWPDTSRGDGKIVEDFVKIYEDANPNIRINLDASEVNSYKDKLKVIFSGDDIPDVYFTYGAGFSKPFIDSGKVLNINDYLDPEAKERLLGGVESNFIYNEELYGLPVKMWAGVMYVNRELFEKEGLEYPKTWEELLSVVDQFREKGYQPMCLGGKDAWHAAMYHDILSVREVSVEGIDKALMGEKPFNDPEFLETATKFYELVEHDAFNDGFIAQGAQEAQAEFLMGKIPMYFNGSWLTGDIQADENQVKDKIDVIAFPITDEANGNTEFTGGAVDGYSVSALTKYPEIAVDFMQKLSEYQSVESYKVGDGISVWKSEVETAELNPVLVKISELLQTSTGYTLAWDTRLTGSDIDTFLTSLQDLQAGLKTPEEYVDFLEENLELEQ